MHTCDMFPYHNVQMLLHSSDFKTIVSRLVSMYFLLFMFFALSLLVFIFEKSFTLDFGY